MFIDSLPCLLTVFMVCVTVIVAAIIVKDIIVKVSGHKRPAEKDAETEAKIAEKRMKSDLISHLNAYELSVLEQVARLAEAQHDPKSKGDPAAAAGGISEIIKLEESYRSDLMNIIKEK
jgi:flagellar biosynthesis/type III secretory pathway M-ring protein FliF/YscJ